MDNILTTSRLFTPRPYQRECLDVIAAQPPGAYLVQMATGLGKTAVFTHIPHEGRMLILSHREELVRQPLQGRRETPPPLNRQASGRSRTPNEPCG